MPIREYTNETHFAILSILASDEQRIEIVLGENFKEPSSSLDSNLASAKDRILADPRVKFFPSSQYLTMSENWARSLRLSTGEFVAFVGADDGVVSDNLSPVTTFLEHCDSDLVFTSYTTFFYKMQDQDSFVHFQERTTCNSAFEIVFHPAINALFLGTRELMMPVIFNKSIARRSLLTKAISENSPVPGIAPDNYLTHFMMRHQKRGIYLNYPVFISGGSKLSNGRAQVSEPTNPIFQEYSVDHQSRMGYLTKRFTLACLSAGMIEDYLSANNRTGLLDNFFLRISAQSWILFSCFDQKHHQGRLFSVSLPIRRMALGVAVRLMGKLWSWRHFGLTNHFKAKTILLPESSTVLDIQKILCPS